MIIFALADRKTDDPVPTIVTRHSAREQVRPYAESNVRILLVEDNVINQQVALGILERLGLSAKAVFNGAEALDALAESPYDLIFMDIQMPVMDGFEATSRIRAAKQRQQEMPNGAGVDESGKSCPWMIPIIAMTAHAMQGDRERCLDAGMNDYLSKPITVQALVDVLEKWLPGIRKDVPNPSTQDRISSSECAGDIPSTVPSSNTEIFDRKDLLGRLMGDQAMARRILIGFLDELPRQIQALRDFLNEGDILSVERQAHSIKGASATVGGEALRSMAFKMEKAAKSEDLNALQGYMAEIESQFEVLKTEIIRGEDFRSS